MAGRNDNGGQPNKARDADAPRSGRITGREEGLAPDEPLSDFEAEVASHPLGGRPMSDVTDHQGPGGDEETIDGLDPLAESVRHAAEDIPVGERRKRP